MELGISKTEHYCTVLFYILLFLLLQVNWVFMFMTLVDLFFCSSFLIWPLLTCEGNTYIRCLPFLFNSYLANILIFTIKFPNLYESERPDRRIPFIAVFNIMTLTLYGGLAGPLHLAWMETFKPFSAVVLVNRKEKERRNSDAFVKE